MLLPGAGDFAVAKTGWFASFENRFGGDFVGFLLSALGFPGVKNRRFEGFAGFPLRVFWLGGCLQLYSTLCAGELQKANPCGMLPKGAAKQWNSSLVPNPLIFVGPWSPSENFAEGFWVKNPIGLAYNQQNPFGSSHSTHENDKQNSGATRSSRPDCILPDLTRHKNVGAPMPKHV